MTETEYLLTCLGEECAEVQQRISKAQRFGLAEVEPGQDHSNAARIDYELGDLFAVLGMLRERNVLPDVDASECHNRMQLKRRKVEKYMRYSEQCGTLERSNANSTK